MKNVNAVIIGLGVAGVIVLVTGVTLGWYGFPEIIAGKIKDGVLLVNDSEAYERWRELPLAIQFKVYFFNVTNPDQAQNGYYPEVNEVGPYVYDQYREKFDITDEEYDTLSYTENSLFYFNKEESGNLSENDVVTVLNIVLMGTMLELKKVLSPEFELNTVTNTIVSGSEKVFQTATVRELLWDGVAAIDCRGTESPSEGKVICSLLKPHLPVMIAEHEPGLYKMAYLRHKNNSNDGRYRVNRGISDNRALGRIEEWNGHSRLTTWAGGACNDINGTDSTIFPPFWTPEDNIYIFVSDVCRSLYAEFDSEVKWRGLPAFHYIGSDRNLEAAEDFPPNVCFCEHTKDGSPQCLKSGVLDLYNCLGMSIIMSWPHFYSASPEYQMYVHGLLPDREKHETFVDIEPESGAILRGARRMQINMFLTRMNNLRALTNVTEGLFPILWIDEELVSLPQAHRTQEGHLVQARKVEYTYF